jgi:DNA-binding Lrp family transcriptional regulator
MNCNKDFLICRNYALLHNRVLLYRQDELRELEQELLFMDEAAKSLDDTMLKSRSREERFSCEKRNLIDRIDTKLLQYNDVVQRTRFFATLQRAKQRNCTSVRNWVDQSAPLVQEEASTFYNDSDFVSVVDGKDEGWLDRRIETVLDKLGGPIGRVSDTPSSCVLSPNTRQKSHGTSYS